MDFYEKLLDLFPNHDTATIKKVVEDVSDELPTGNPNEQFERMVTLLIDNYSDQASQCLDVQGNQLVAQLQKRFPDACPNYISNFLLNEGVALDYTDIVQQFLINGYQKPSNTASDLCDRKVAELQNNILQIFPDASEQYIVQCAKDGLNLDQMIDKFITEGYKSGCNGIKVRNDRKINAIHAELCGMLPTYDPDYLLQEAEKLQHSDENAISQCAALLLEQEVYPTIEEYNKREIKKKRMLKYLFDFKIDGFLKEFSNSLISFENPKRRHALEGRGKNYEQDRDLARTVLHFIYHNCPVQLINTKFKQCNYDIIKCSDQLEKPSRVSFTESEIKLPPNGYNNLLLFQELAYVINRMLLNNYQRLRKAAYDKAYQEAQENNLLQTCQCCYDDGLLLLPEECYSCSSGCFFCKQCMIKGCEVAYAEGHLDIECFVRCGGFFRDAVLQMVMEPVACYKLLSRKQIRDLREANVDGFEMCPLCNDYGTILRPQDKILYCKNPECFKEVCRECQHVAHVPKRCSEIEYDEDVKMRTHIEDQMTAALLRTCKTCNRQIIKESGCNKMTCDCGTTMCYVCGATKITYAHFSATGCPQVSDQDAMHRNDVLRGIKAAKAELGVDKNPNKLKFDPSKGF